MDTDAFRFREETFRNGMPPHGGFAIGRERITACFLGNAAATFAILAMLSVSPAVNASICGNSVWYVSVFVIVLITLAGF
jgi:hypothetical protein